MVNVSLPWNWPQGCWFAPSGEISNWSPYTGGEGRREKEAGHSIFVGGRFNEEEDLYMRLVLGPSTQVVPRPTCQNLKVYIEAFPGFSHIFSPHGVDNTLVF